MREFVLFYIMLVLICSIIIGQPNFLSFGAALAQSKNTAIPKLEALSESVPGSASNHPLDDENKIQQTTILSDAQERSKNKLKQVKGEIVPGQYIVVLKNDRPTDPRAVANEARNQGVVVRHVYEYAIKGFAIRVPNQQVLDRLLANPRIDYVEPDMKVKALSQILPTGINRVDGDLSQTKSGDGTGSVNVDIAILDSGIDLTHPDLNVFEQITFVSGTSSGNDDEGHGYHGSRSGGSQG